MKKNKKVKATLYSPAAELLRASLELLHQRYNEAGAELEELNKAVRYREMESDSIKRDIDSFEAAFEILSNLQ